MIDYFNIPAQAQIDMPISKKLFAEKVALSSVEKRILREDIDRIVMKGLLQTRTVGVASYIDDEFSYDQIIFAVVNIKNQAKASAIAGMVQKAFPSPMFLILNYQENYCVNWCIKRINQADKSKRVIEEQHMTRFFSTLENNSIIHKWLHSLDMTKFNCMSLKDLFDILNNRLMMLTISEEANCFLELSSIDLGYYQDIIVELKLNRIEQQTIIRELKCETQFNKVIKLNTLLRELQDQEIECCMRLKGNEESSYNFDE
ncbi:DUF4391 domain-containing protein [Proteiniphilum sp. UBA5384]|uniref:DUF4391 domain-containing protein n=1 Tax=Proteiniphilum sp. UBA5384 TaxID=1947279 RepID=UPI0025D603E7|nr:DUF4391 domain-containing protein [Proteiniphilum sp. UBA5384]